MGPQVLQKRSVGSGHGLIMQTYKQKKMLLQYETTSNLMCILSQNLHIRQWTAENSLITLTHVYLN